MIRGFAAAHHYGHLLYAFLCRQVLAAAALDRRIIFLSTLMSLVLLIQLQIVPRLVRLLKLVYHKIVDLRLLNLQFFFEKFDFTRSVNRFF